jgi:uncharacterized membrane protein YozB (DUF420 family)
MHESSTVKRDDGRKRRRGMWIASVLLAGLVLLFGLMRFSIDLPLIRSGTVPDPESFEFRYVEVPWLAYGHIVPALIFLLIAPVQLWRGFRQRHWTLHRRLGRVGVGSAVVAGVFGTVFGVLMAFGGAAEAIAAAVFGAYFQCSEILAYRSIRRKNVRSHRRWMIRAASIALAAGTIRIWVALLSLAGIEFNDAFGAAFWLGFGIHAIAAELYLAWRPEATGFRRTKGTKRGEVEGFEPSMS